MSKEEQIKKYVSRQLNWIQNLPEHPQKAELANLRRGVGKVPGELPELWGSFLQEMPDELKSRTDIPTAAEWAIYLALTLYALHQQGHSLQTDNMYRPKMPFGRAVRWLVAPNMKPWESSIQKRFNALATASQPQKYSQHLRGIIQLMRTAGIPLDYPQLAADLFYLQMPYSAARVCLRWGQDFYTAPYGNDLIEGDDDYG